MTDEDLIAKYLAKHGASKCPTRPAATLGESSPGWRRNVEREAERRDTKAKRLQQRRMAERYVPPTKDFPADALTAKPLIEQPTSVGLPTNPPTEKQIRYAKFLADRTGSSLPAGYDTDRNICGDFIARAKLGERADVVADIKRIRNGGPLKHEPGPWDEGFDG
jgi:hypothetical protein